MTTEFVSGFIYETLKITMLISAPMLLFGLVAGLLVGVFQATTQIHEMTLTFIPKIIAVALAVLMFLPWIMRVFLGFTSNIFSNLNSYVG